MSDRLFDDLDSEHELLTCPCGWRAEVTDWDVLGSDDGTLYCPACGKDYERGEV